MEKVLVKALHTEIVSFRQSLTNLNSDSIGIEAGKQRSDPYDI